MFHQPEDGSNAPTFNSSFLPETMPDLLKVPLVCSFGQKAHGRGIFFGESPLGKSYNAFSLQLILMVMAYQLIYYILRPLKQTKFVCSVLAGILIGPNMLGKFHVFGNHGLFPEKDIFLMNPVGYLGIGLFIFLLAIKMDVTMLCRTGKEAVIIGTLSYIVPLAATFAATHFLPLPGVASGFFRVLFSSGMSVTRFPNVADAFGELNMLTSQQSQLVLSSTMLDEIFGWVSLVSGLCYRNRTRHFIPMWVFITIVGVAAASIALRYLFNKITARMTRMGHPVNEVLFVSIILIAFLLAFLTDLVGSFHMGLFIFGLALPDGPPLGSGIINRAQSIVVEFMMPMFYVVVGFNTNITAINWKFQDIVVLVSLSFTTKFLSTMAGALLCRHHFKNSILLGLMMNIKGPIDLYLMLRWKKQKELSENDNAVLVLSHVFVTALVTPLIEKLYKESQRTKVSERLSMKSVQSTSSYETFKVLCCVHGEDNVPGIISLIEASNGSNVGKLSAVIVQLNDLLGRAAPVVVRNDDKLRRIESSDFDRVALQFETHIRNTGDKIPLANFTVVAPYKTIHENVRHIAKEEGATLIILPYRKVHGEDEASGAVVAQSTAIRNFNCHMLACNPCAVGIFVNKGLGRCLSFGSSFSCNVAIIFAGGHDDREALAYATRLLMQRSVRVTLLRLVVRTPQEYVEDMLEKKLDDGMVEDFRILGCMDPSRASYYEKPALDLITTFDAIRSLQDDYHLVITGRESSLLMSLFEESLDTLKNWGETPELGIIGDFIASDDYNGGRSSALIMQRYPTRNNILASICASRSDIRYEENCLLGR